MPDKKLTDTEIKKALEDLVKCNNNEIDCGSCTLSKFYPRCPEEIGELALDLINRLQEEKEALINGQETLQKYIADLQAENERLKPFEDKIAEFNSHIRVEDMLVFASSLEEWLEFCDNLKSEAHKEFAELLHCQCESIINQPHNENVRPISWKVAYEEFDEKIDNLLKEMVGE